MAEGKKAFVVYTNWKEYIDDLTNEQVGTWTRWMFDYCNDKWLDKEIEYPADAAVKVLCKLTKDILKTDLTKYKDKKKRIDEINERKRVERETKSKQSQNEIDNEIEHDIVNESVDSNKLLVISNKKSVISKDIEKEKSNKEKKAAAFKTPTLEEITQYCQERNNLVDPERFFNFYEAKGWMVGKNKMKDWKAAVRTWESEAGFKSNDSCGFVDFQKLGESDEEYEKRTGIRRAKRGGFGKYDVIQNDDPNGFGGNEL